MGIGFQKIMFPHVYFWPNYQCKDLHVSNVNQVWELKTFLWLQLECIPCTKLEQFSHQKLELTPPKEAWLPNIFKIHVQFIALLLFLAQFNILLWQNWVHKHIMGFHSIMNFNKNVIMIHRMVFRSTIPFKDFVTKQILVLKFLRDCSFDRSLDMSLEQHAKEHKNTNMKTNTTKWQEHPKSRLPNKTNMNIC